MSFSYYRIFSIPDDAVDRQKVRNLILIRFNFKNSLKAFLETIIPLNFLLSGKKRFPFDSTSFIIGQMSSPTHELNYIQ